MRDHFHYHKNLIILGSVLGLTAILLGAYGTHVLAPKVDDATYEAFETAVRYQMYHALFAIIAGALRFLSKRSSWVLLGLIAVGVLCFSGSIYGLSTADMTGYNYARFSFLTPLGGFFFMGAWIVLIVQTIRAKRS